MRKADLINVISRKSGMKKVDCERVIDTFIDTIIDALVKNKKIIIKGFMSFDVIQRGERKGRNPKTGEIELFKPTKVIKCKMSELVKKIVNEE